MSCIDKMSIMGIRSFDNTSRETIQFYAPLTLIVGHNGAGKTTIIECLKYATTGILPPNSKGGAFIHDPKFCGEKEVLAQVKLAFQNTNGVRMICTRSLQLTMKRTTRQMKTLDGQLLVTKNGERSTVSNRCAELDQQVPLSLGVTRALLDYVIFCHQEESFWPLSEPATLKKRFDEIFESMRYAKALDQIKVLRKDQTNQIKVDNATLAHFKSDKERAEKIEDILHENQKKVAALKAEVDLLDEELVEVAKEQDELFQHTEKYEQTIAEINKLERENELVNETLSDLAKNMVFYEETDEELEDLSCHYSEKVEGEMEWYQRSENEINSLNSQLQITRQKNSSFLAIVGQARAEVKLHEERLQERDRLMKELKSIYGYDIQSSEGVYEAHSLKIKSLEAEWKSIKQKNEHGISQISSKIENIRAQKSFLMQERQQNKKRMAVFENNINSLKKRLSEFEGNFEDISALEVSIADAETALSSYRNEYVKSDWESKLTAMKQELRELNESYQNTVELVHKAASQANDRAKLSMLRSRKLKLMEQKQSLFDELIAEYTEITREKVTSETIDLASSLKTLSANVDKLTLEEQRVSKESTELNLKLTLAYERNESIAEQLEEFDAQLKSSTGNPDQLSSEIEEIEAQIEEQRKDLHSLQFGVLFYERAIKVSDEKHACQLCRRGLDDSERKEFTKYCNSMVLTIPSKAQDLEKELTQLETTLNQLRSLLPIQERYIALSSDLEKAKKEIAELEDDFSSVSKKHKEKQASLELEKEKLQKLTALSSKMSNVDRLRDEALTTGESIRELETTLSNTGTAETIESLQEKLKDLETQTSQKREEYRVFENAFEDAKKQLVSLESKKSEDSMMLRETKLRLREKQNIQMNLNDNKSNLEEGEIAVQNINKKLSSNDEEMQELDKQLNSLKNEAQDELNCFSEKLRIAREQYTKLQSLMVAIKNDTSADALKTAEENCEQTSSQIKNFEEKIQEKTNERAEFEKKLHNLKDNERNIADNLRYRRLKQQLSQSMSRLQQLKKELQNVDRENFMLNSQNLKEKYGQLNAKRAGFLGECRQLEGQIAHNTRELQIDYKDAKERYRRQLIKTKTLDKANEDLGKYGRALDNAIMQFHSLKMNEVNRIIDEAWKQTYCGTDIDTILIRSDNETKGNRSYNYRVCMVKGDAELDMRGRCSAGQKVLACIIIRLALAECFGINCGILALDEPTTNLDDENICSLAQSLARIVEFRRRQRNFQLIVITHDERFIRLMNTESYCDYYYRVTRDENQNSIILRELIRDHNF